MIDSSMLTVQLKGQRRPHKEPPSRFFDRGSLLFRSDVFFYFTGLTHVPHLETLHFLPGAIADHLTSAGGVLDGTGQMSALRWLEAGATGSYGAVVEPPFHFLKANYRELPKLDSFVCSCFRSSNRNRERTYCFQ